MHSPTALSELKPRISLLIIIQIWNNSRFFLKPSHPTVPLKVPKCEILISWILMIFYHEVSVGRGLEGWNKNFTFFTDGWDMGHFVFATACAVYASKLLLCAQSALANCYPMRSVRQQIAIVYAACPSKLRTQFFVILHNFTRFATACAVCSSNLLPYAQFALAIGYRMCSVR